MYTILSYSFINILVSDRHFQQFKIKEHKIITHNTSLYIIDYPFSDPPKIPLGHHVSVR
jgi:NAD(P)H-flavin reductase